MAIRVSDSFIDTAGKLLSDHVGETGASWAIRSGDTGSIVITDANRIRCSTTAFALYYASGVLDSGDQDISVTLHLKSDANQLVGIYGRTDPATPTTYYRVLYRNDPATPRFDLQKNVSGTLTTLGSFNFTPTAGSDTAVLLQLRDAAKKVFVDGVERISSTDNEVTAGRRSGLSGQVASSDTAGLHLDNFKAEDTTPTLVTGSDTGTISATETTSITTTITASDSGTITATETSEVVSTTFVEITGSDSGTITGTETSAVVALLEATDTGTVGATESAVLASTLAVADSGSVGATEAAAIAAALTSTDSGTVSATEASAIITGTFLSVSDSGTISAAETATATTLTRVFPSRFFARDLVRLTSPVVHDLVRRRS